MERKNVRWKSQPKKCQWISQTPGTCTLEQPPYVRSERATIGLRVNLFWIDRRTYEYIVKRTKLYLVKLIQQSWNKNFKTGLSISDFSLIDKPKRVFFLRKRLSIRGESLIDKTGLPKKVWQYRLTCMAVRMRNYFADRQRQRERNKVVHSFGLNFIIFCIVHYLYLEKEL